MDNLWIWWLVGFNPSEKYEFVKWDDDIPNIWENKSCSKPPTNNQTWLAEIPLIYAIYGWLWKNWNLRWHQISQPAMFDYQRLDSRKRGAANCIPYPCIPKNWSTMYYLCSCDWVRNHLYPLWRRNPPVVCRIRWSKCGHSRPHWLLIDPFLANKIPTGRFNPIWVGCSMPGYQ